MFYLFAPLNIRNRLATGKNLEPSTQRRAVYLLNNYILSTGVVPALGSSVCLGRKSILFLLIGVSFAASDVLICTWAMGLHDLVPFVPTGPTNWNVFHEVLFLPSVVNYHWTIIAQGKLQHPRETLNWALFELLSPSFIPTLYLGLQ